MLPPAAAPFAAEWHTALEPARVLAVLRQPLVAILPLLPLRVEFWNRHWLDATPVAAALLGLCVVAAGAWIFRRPRAAQVLWLAGAGASLAFAYLKFAGHARHFGVLFLLFVGAAWLAAAAAPGARAAGRVRAALGVVLGFQLAAGLFAAGVDLARPFSANRDAVRFLRAHAEGATTIVADPRTHTRVLEAELPLPMVFAVWGPGLMNALVPRKPEAALATARELAAERGPVLLLLGYALEPQPPDVALLASFERSISRERYWVYELPAGARTGAPRAPRSPRPRSRPRAPWRRRRRSPAARRARPCTCSGRA
jgi:hypothetical protein